MKLVDFTNLLLVFDTFDTLSTVRAYIPLLPQPLREAGITEVFPTALSESCLFKDTITDVAKIFVIYGIHKVVVIATRFSTIQKCTFLHI